MKPQKRYTSRKAQEFDINKMPRSLKAWEAAIAYLNDGNHHYYLEVMHVMLEASDIRPQTIVQLLKEMCKQELIREDESGRWLFRPQFQNPELKWLHVSSSPDGVHPNQEEKTNEMPDS